MKIEFEAKFIIDSKDEAREKLRSAGAKLIIEERMMRRKVYDYPDGRLEDDGGWVRVRDEGDKITMSYKQQGKRSISGTREVDIVVDDFDNSCSFLETIGLVQKSFQESRRESWRLGEAEIEIDTWPWIPSYVEIEAGSETQVKNIAQKIGFDWGEAYFGSVEIVYCQYYDVTEKEVCEWEEIKFEPVPEWLAGKKK